MMPNLTRSGLRFFAGIAGLLLALVAPVTSYGLTRAQQLHHEVECVVRSFHTVQHSLRDQLVAVPAPGVSYQVAQRQLLVRGNLVAAENPNYFARSDYRWQSGTKRKAQHTRQARYCMRFNSGHRA